MNNERDYLTDNNASVSVCPNVLFRLKIANNIDSTDGYGKKPGKIFVSERLKALQLA